MHSIHSRFFMYLLLGTWTSIVAPPLAANANALEAGFINLTLVDPVEGGAMQAIVAYPTLSAAASTTLGPFTIAASPGSVPEPGLHPLVVVSHGTGGSSLGHHDSLTALARAGFVAVAVEHPRDNYRDDSGFGTDLQLIGRPHHIVALIDAILVDPKIGSIVDRGRIGMAGHSVGGYTTLAIAGAQPDLRLAAAYRQAVTSDPYTARAEAAGGQRRKPELQYVSDPRVRSIYLMAPAIGYLFDKAALAKVTIPVRLIRAAADEMLPHPQGVENIAQSLPVPPDYWVLDGAGHFVFLAPCSEMLASIAKQICTDPPGIDRVAIHERLNTDMIAFFRKTLASP